MKLIKEEKIYEHAKKLHLSNLRKNYTQFLIKAEENQPSYLDFLLSILESEVHCRLNTAKNKRIRQAHFPALKYLKDFELSRVTGLNQSTLNEMAECLWIKNTFNLIFIGPAGIGKTHLAITLGIEAATKGFLVSFVTAKELVELLKSHELGRSDKSRMERIKKTDLLIIDEIGYYPLNELEAGLFFHFLNELHEKTSFLITSNKKFRIGLNSLEMNV